VDSLGEFYDRAVKLLAEKGMQFGPNIKVLFLGKIDDDVRQNRWDKDFRDARGWSIKRADPIDEDDEAETGITMPSNGLSHSLTVFKN
jgi:hypothetical protein